MKDLPEYELLSAYLDGELTAAEQADAEQLLARSPAARQLLEDLRALSSKLQALPQCKLGEDLGQHVLRAAQQRMLAASPASGKLPCPVPPPRRAILRRLVNPRALVWSSLAVAVAVILVVMERGPKRQIAVAPPAKEEAAKEKARPTAGIGLARKEGVLQREPVDAEPGETSGQTEEFRKAGSQPAPDEFRAKDGAADLAETHDSAAFTASALQGKRYVAENVQIARGGRVAKGAAGSPPVQWDLLVQCHISPQAQGKEVFDKALADNGIVWDAAPAGAGVLNGGAAAVRGQRLKQLTQPEPEDSARPALEAVPAEKLDVVYVQAPWVQFKGLWAALKARPDAVSLVSSEPVTGDETPKGPSRYLAGQVRLREGGGAGAAFGLQVGGAAAEAPAGPPEQRSASGYEGQDNLQPRAYARWFQLPTPGLNLGATFGGGTEPTGKPPQSGPPGPSAPTRQKSQPEKDLAGQPQQQEARRTDAGAPMVRALFVLHVADLKSATASDKAKPDAAKAASESRKAAPPPAAEQ